MVPSWLPAHIADVRWPIAEVTSRTIEAGRERVVLTCSTPLGDRMLRFRLFHGLPLAAGSGDFLRTLVQDGSPPEAMNSADPSRYSTCCGQDSVLYHHHPPNRLCPMDCGDRSQDKETVKALEPYRVIETRQR